ncbi:hypothetical protein JVT61DRAFT_8984 [Boletus reticuloceps]|uniref:non-specific serine/threonine protein kinase n=1 Tax=Boletus reticuloceps TaxID=495285 RepID=A0A8I2YII8_9AGAM|nr:hypothetical protein JVT61DRAFT_8984 [Boletus reticuloceps]
MAQARFFICLNDEVFPGPPVDKRMSLGMLFYDLLTYPATPRGILAGVRDRDCSFYKLTPPLLSPGMALKGLEDACFKLNSRHGWTPVDSACCVQDLASVDCLSSFKHVCLVIETPQVSRAQAIKDLGDNYKALFQPLKIYVVNIKSWSMIDVVYNMNGGVFWHHGEQPNEKAVRDIVDALSRRREFDIEPSDTSSRFARDLDMVHTEFPVAFDLYFRKDSPRVKGSAELFGVYSLIRSSLRLKQSSHNSSSCYKGIALCPLFFQPPFCDSGVDSGIVLNMDFPWGFPIFIATHDGPVNWCRFTPSSDYSVTVKDFLCPFLLCIAAVRAVNVLKKPSNNRDLFVVAVYLMANMTAERYIIMQTSTGQVHVAQHDYNLVDVTDALEFLKAMFNLQDQMSEFANELDNSRGQREPYPESPTSLVPLLLLLVSERPRVEPRKTNHCGRSRKPLNSPEHLDRMHYRVDRFLPGFPHVAVISCESDPLEQGILKFTRRQSEVDVLQHLSKFTCEENHSIPGVQVWTLPSKGFVIYSCFGGSHFTNISKPDVHMWSAARQLVEGVAFMHSQGVAHLDIKPANVLVHPDSGRLTIIDYSISQFIKPDTKLHAVRGTEDYIAPEVTVKDAEYDPIRADLWSCGKTLEELIGCCRRSTEETSFLVGIVGQLMAGNPLARPMMSEVSKRIIAFECSTVKRPQSGRFAGSSLLCRDSEH